jgi:transposase
MVYYTLDDFPDEATCLEWLKNRRYPDGIYCPNCQRVTKHHASHRYRYYTCQNCGNHVHPTADTIFHKSSTPLTIWFYTFYRILDTHGKISAAQIQRETGVTYKTAWRMRKMILDQLGKKNDLFMPMSLPSYPNQDE